MKVSPACKHCYADTLSARYGERLWGHPETTARKVIKSSFSTLAKIRRLARKSGVRRRVFSNSMSDFFEDVGGYHPEINTLRDKALTAMEQSTELDFLLLTKRPENIIGIVPSRWLTNWPRHILIGVSAENQTELEKRLIHLLKVPARRFLSCEPLLGHLDFNKALAAATGIDIIHHHDYDMSDVIHWIIAGGESGRGQGIRPMHPDHLRGVRDWCTQYHVPFFFKQWGRYYPIYITGNTPYHYVRGNLYTVYIDGKEMKAYKNDREPDILYVDFGDKKDRSTLDGVEHKEFYRHDFRVMMFHDCDNPEEIT